MSQLPDAQPSPPLSFNFSSLPAATAIPLPPWPGHLLLQPLACPCRMSNFAFVDKYPWRTPAKSCRGLRSAADLEQESKGETFRSSESHAGSSSERPFHRSQQSVRNLLSGIRAVQQRTAKIKDNHFQFQSGRNSTAAVYQGSDNALVLSLAVSWRHRRRTEDGPPQSRPARDSSLRRIL